MGQTQSAVFEPCVYRPTPQQTVPWKDVHISGIDGSAMFALVDLDFTVNGKSHSHQVVTGYDANYRQLLWNMAHCRPSA